MMDKVWIVYAGEDPETAHASEQEAIDAARVALNYSSSGAVYSIRSATLDPLRSFPDPGIPIYASRDATDDVLGDKK